jgi:plastocyanin
MGRLAVLVLAAGTAALAVPAFAADGSVNVANFAYSPGSIEVNQGEKVTWTWAGPDTNHSVTSTSGAAESFESHPGVPTAQVNDAPPGGSFTHTFANAGTSTYLCRVHPFMTGRVVVRAVAGGPPPQPTPTGGSTTPSESPVSPQNEPATGSPTPQTRTSPRSLSPRARQRRSRGRCRSRRRFRIRLREPRGVTIRTASVVVNGKRARVARRSVAGRTRQTAEVDLRGLRRGSYKVRITATTTIGEVLRGTREYRTCAKRRVPGRPPKL